MTLSQRGCEYEGPGSAPVGEINLEVGNTTDEFLYAALLSIDGGHAYDELVAWVQGPEAMAGPPGWVTTVVDGEGRRWANRGLTATVVPGTYAIVCATPKSPSGGIWAAGTFSVPA